MLTLASGIVTAWSSFSDKGTSNGSRLAKVPRRLQILACANLPWQASAVSR